MNEETQQLMFSSASNEWSTPAEMFHQLELRFGPFTLDPAATAANAKCPKFFTAEDDGLLQSWQGHSVFCNPPYGRQIGKWVEKAFKESRQPATQVVLLIPARTDTAYWHEYVMRSDCIAFIKGRLRFGNSKNCAPFPSAVIFMGFIDADRTEAEAWLPGLMVLNATHKNAQEATKAPASQPGHMPGRNGQAEGARGPHKPPPL